MPHDASASESFLSIERKLYRAKEHFDELSGEVRTYYKSNPGRVEVTPRKDGGASVHFVENKPTPAKFGLIFGDFVQCLRSALDYLVWELVRASGAEGTYKHQYPVAETEDAFIKALGNGSLDAVPQHALSLIRANQPFTRTQPRSHFLWILNSLANINKHRRVLLTIFGASVGERPAEFPYIKTIVKLIAEDGTEIEYFEVWSCLRLGEGYLPLIELLTASDALFEDVHRLIMKFWLFFHVKTQYGHLISEPSSTRPHDEVLMKSLFSSRTWTPLTTLSR